LLHPGEEEANLALIPAFVEEGMRWDAAAGFVRTPTHTGNYTASHPGRIASPAAIGSANRDEREFADPDRFDIHRSDQRHLGMGQGIHFCVGSPLGRVMAQFLFEELLPISARWEIDHRQWRASPRQISWLYPRH
jgi:cytochrome P450